MQDGDHVFGLYEIPECCAICVGGRRKKRRAERGGTAAAAAEPLVPATAEEQNRVLAPEPPAGDAAAAEDKSAAAAAPPADAAAPGLAHEGWEEARETGHVKARVYWEYARAAGAFLAAVIAISFICMQACNTNISSLHIPGFPFNFMSTRVSHLLTWQLP